ncbi:MAG: serine acetyltransferase, partial [Isosphaeraceae bacterium]
MGQRLEPSERLVSATTPDWERERCRRFWDPGRRLLQAIRRYQASRRRGFLGRLASKYWVLSHRFWSVVAGADVPLDCQIGGGLLLTHPNGVVIHPEAKVGPNCLLFQQVTLGLGGPKPGAPVLGGHVDVGAGAKILGGVTIGDHARIGANAVVLQDVP